MARSRLASRRRRTRARSLAGLGVGIVAAAESFGPSLLPRTRTDQAIVVATALTFGTLAGVAVDRAAGVLGKVLRLGGHTTRLGVGAALGIVAGWRAARDDPGRSPASLPAATALALAGRAAPPLAGPAGAGLLATAVAALRSGVAAHAREGRPVPTPRDAVRSLGTGAALAAGVAALGTVERHAARRVAPGFVGHGVVSGALLLPPLLLARRHLRRLEAAADVLEPPYSSPPDSPLVSGGPGSAVDFRTLGREGRRFVHGRVSLAAIREVTATPRVREPIRVYVGQDSASSLDDRVALAVAELHRTDAFARSLLIVVSPSGSGYVDPIPIETAEYLTGGDVATVVIQYGKRPSVFSPDRIRVGSRQHRMLLEAIAAPVRSGRCRLVLYGESLGARTSQDAFRDGDVAVLRRLGVERALWVGTPAHSPLRDTLLAAGRDHDEGAVVRVGGAAELAALPAATRRRIRCLFLDHPDDPVTRFDLALACRRPGWLGSPAARPRGVPRSQRWLPLVTFLQTAFDTLHAAEVVPGRLEARSHDYRGDLPTVVRIAFGLGEADPARRARLEARLRNAEIIRAARLA